MFFQVCLCFVAITLMINVQNGDCYLRGDETKRVLQIPASSLSGSFSSGSGSNGFSNVRFFDHFIQHDFNHNLDSHLDPFQAETLLDHSMALTDDLVSKW
jgi:hypothetical protein